MIRPAQGKICSTSPIKLAEQKLYECYPKCFSRDDPKPLKLGILENLKQDKKTHKRAPYQLRNTLHFYTQRDSYLQSCQKGAQRIALSGEPTGDVSDKHIAHVNSQLLKPLKARLQLKKFAHWILKSKTK